MYKYEDYNETLDRTTFVKLAVCRWQSIVSNLTCSAISGTMSVTTNGSMNFVSMQNVSTLVLG